MAALLHHRKIGLALLRTLLLPATPLYRGITATRGLLYNRGILLSRRLPRPVISVGNLTTGGTGKTPIVIKIVEELTLRGVRMAVLSRGYRGSAGRRVNIVSDPEGLRLDARQAGDEPYLMAMKLPGTPVLTGKDRFPAGMEAIRRFNPDCLILDDGFQHLSLRRDINLLVLDGEAPFGNGRCLPAGDLREGISAVARANRLILTGSGDKTILSRIRAITPDTPIYRVRFVSGGLREMPERKPRSDATLSGKRVLAFCGIARPQRFFRSVNQTGAEVVIERSFPDHHAYRNGELQQLIRQARKKRADFLITTEKDAVRLSKFPDSPPLLTLELAVRIKEQEAFFGDLLRSIEQPRNLQTGSKTRVPGRPALPRDDGKPEPRATAGRASWNPGRPAVFLDRDGTINEEVGYLNDPERLALIPGSAEAIRRINRAGMAAVIITNQSGIARGFFDEETLASIHERLKEILSGEKAHLDGIYVCPHHTDGKIPEYTRECDCRKPGTALVKRAARELNLDLSASYMIGDHFKDIQLAAEAGIPSILVLTGHGRGEWEKADRKLRLRPDHVAENLSSAVDWILEQKQERQRRK